MRVILGGDRRDNRENRWRDNRDRRRQDNRFQGSKVGEKRTATEGGSGAFKSKKALRTLLTVLQEMEE